MRILPSHVIPLFLNQGTITGQIAAQLRSFDVYYITPPAVGFCVIGCEECAAVVGFNIDSESESDAVLGFHASAESDPGPSVVGFNVESEDNAFSCGG